MMINQNLIWSAALLCAACAAPSATPTVVGKWRCEHPRLTQTLHFGADHSLIRTLTLRQPKRGMRFHGTWQWQNGYLHTREQPILPRPQDLPAPAQEDAPWLSVRYRVRVPEADTLLLQAEKDAETLHCRLVPSRH